MHRNIRTFLLTLLLLLGLPAHSAVMTAMVSFDIDVIVEPNDFAVDFGLMDGDIVTVTATFDDAGLTGVGFESILLDAFSLVIGTLSLDETDDIDFGGGFFPAIDFLDGSFLSFSFLAEVDAGAAPDLFEVAFDEGFFDVILLSEDPMVDDELVITNIGAIDETTVNIIPVPAALPLLGTALAGLFGLGALRRRA